LELIENQQKQDKSNKKQLGNVLSILPIDQTVDVVTIVSAPEKVAGDGNNKKTKKPQQPCYVRRNMWRKQMDAYVSLLNNLGKAPAEECTVVHVLSKQELADLCDHGAQVIHLDKPHRDIENNNISWNVVTQSVFDNEHKYLLKTNTVFITTYDQLQHDPKLIFLGSYYTDEPAPDAWVLLALVMQRLDSTIEENESCVDVDELYSKCCASKRNIVDGTSSKHHDSRGAIFGFGARREFSGIKMENGSSLGQYVSLPGKEFVADELEDYLVGEMSTVHNLVHCYARQDLHKMNAVQLVATETQAVSNNYDDDFHLKGGSCYTSLYYNFSASTMHFHTEMDWTMTTLFVPLQNWEGKDSNHLQFQLRLCDKENFLVNISMMPGTMIYFHGYLLTHHQMHDNGNCRNKSCCMNYSGYANQTLRWFSFTTNGRAKEM